MAWVSFFALVLWLPVVVYLFERFTAQKAIVFSFIAAWLFLPPTQIPLAGFPDWSKTTATVFSVTLCVCLKYADRLFALRFRWYDIPVLVYCVTPFVSSVMNNLGAYDGLSSMLDELFRWGLPYLIGRAFLGTLAGNRQLCLGIAIGGMLYVPLCMIEIRMSPMLKAWVFGFTEGRGVDFSLRYGGYRPMVFLATGLELGWWMCCATLAAYQLWVSGSVKRLYGFPMVVLTMALAVVTVACKSTGALTQIFLGFVIIYFCRFTKNSVLLWALMAIAPAYCIARPTGIWTGEQVVSMAASAFGADRAQSLGFRFENEEVLMRSAMQRPLFGWARSGGFNPPDASGKTAITDGLWIIVFGWMGGVGLAALNLMLLIPTALFLCRFRPTTWLDQDVAPVTALAIILPLFMLDNLSNAMLNPIYAIAMGSLSGYRPRKELAQEKRSGGRGKRRDAIDAPSAGPPGVASRGTRVESSHDSSADQCEAEALLAADQNRIEDARHQFMRAIRNRQAAATAQRSPGQLDRLAATHTLYARFLTQIGQIQPAIVERDRAATLWKSLQDGEHAADFSREASAANLNDLAWLLVDDQASGEPEIERAILCAEEAVQSAVEHAPFWNTLGIARYRHGDYHKAIHALSRSVSLSHDGGNAFDFYYLALANQALGYPKPAAEWLNRAGSWAERHPGLAPMLARARQDVARVFG